MSYSNHLAESRAKRALGLFIGLIAATSLIISLLKYLYFRIDDGTRLGSAVATPFKNLVAGIYEQTQFLSPFWKLSPVPDLQDVLSGGNVAFLLTYVLLFVGLALKASGDSLAKRLSKIRNQIENQLIKESVRGEYARSRIEIEESIQISDSSIFHEAERLYLAPIATAIIAGVILHNIGA
ncbi:MAG: yfeABCD locus regulator [Planctomycetes bacterium]|nr:yfeABCD locus regulator [Planctomycetota bacterium]